MVPFQQGTEVDFSAATEMVRLITGYRLSQVVFVTAHLKIADYLAAGVHSSQELAQVTGTHEPSLYRLLRALAAGGVVEDVGDKHFVLTPFGACLQTNAPNSVRDIVLSNGSEHFWQTWGDLLHCVQTGESAMSHLHDAPNPFVYYAQHADVGAMMSASFTATAQMVVYAVLAVYNFSRYHTIVDVGGGRGQLLAAILQATPEVNGVLFDLPSVTNQSAPLLKEPAIAARCTVVTGDFFVAVPPDGDMYILSRVIHDWDDAQAIAILQQCHRAMKPLTTLLLIETVLPDKVDHSLSSQEQILSDLNMLVRTGGHERTEGEYRRLLTAAEFDVTSIVAMQGVMSLVEARYYEND